MRALCWHGKEDVRVDNVPDPQIEDGDDIILKVTATAICGSDLHLYGSKVPTLKPGDVLGHEFMGIVEDVGSGVTDLKKGDRVVVPFHISCGHCFFANGICSPCAIRPIPTRRSPANLSVTQRLECSATVI